VTRFHELIVDADDPEAITQWWGGVFGLEPRNEGEDWWWLEEVPGLGCDAVVFQPVPEPKTAKNRMHWDLYGDVDDFVSRGAKVLQVLPNWTVMADPEGNEFCVFPEP
jgi:hypothetical protein